MSLVQKALSQTIVYSAFRALGLLISLLSFPILTRQLTVSEYGSLAIINASVTMLAAIAKCGLGMAMLRQYPVAAGDATRQRKLVGAAFLGTVAIWLIIATVYLLFAGQYVGHQARLSTLLTSLVAIMAASTALSDLFSALLRARDAVLQSSAFGSFSRLLSVSVGLLCMAFAQQKLLAFCAGSLIAELALLALAWGREAWRGDLPIRKLDRGDVKMLLAFGLPLVMFEFASLANDYLDRFQIAHFLGLDSVGVYSVGYNLASYTQTVTTWPMWMALFPIYTRLWETAGAAAVSDFLANCLRVFLVVGCGIVMVAVVGSSDLIRILAGRNYVAAASILPIVCAAMMINATTHMVGAGFYLKRRTAVLAAIAVGGAILKALLNLALIPRLGIDGAAWATLVSYCSMTAAIAIMGQRILKVHWPLLRTLAYVTTAVAAASIALQINMGSAVASLVTRCGAATALYFGVILALDAKLRSFGLSVLTRQTKT